MRRHGAHIADANAASNAAAYGSDCDRDTRCKPAAKLCQRARGVAPLVEALNKVRLAVLVVQEQQGPPC